MAPAARCRLRSPHPLAIAVVTAAALSCCRPLSLLLTLLCAIDISVVFRLVLGVASAVQLSLAIEEANSCEQAAVEAIRRAASEALDSLGQVPTYEEVIADTALKRDLYRIASVACSRVALASLSSDLEATRYEVLSVEEELANADCDASKDVVLLNDAKRCPHLHLKLDVQAAASRIRDRLADVSQLKS